MRLAKASRKSVRIAVEAAWARVAPKTLVAARSSRTSSRDRSAANH